MVAIEVKPASPPPFFLGNGLGLRKKVLQILGWGDNAKSIGQSPLRSGLESPRYSISGSSEPENACGGIGQ